MSAVFMLSQLSCVSSSIMNSLVIVLFLSGMVAMIMLRTLHKDIARYNQVDQVNTNAHMVFRWKTIRELCETE